MASLKEIIITAGTRDWAWLPPEILDLILLKLVRLSDYIRFGAVCKAWLSVAQDKKQKEHRSNIWRKQVPLLLIPSQDKKKKERRSLYSISQDKQLNMKLHVPWNRRCCGSSHGWLIFVEIDWAITLFNPFTTHVIHLPPVSKTYIDDTNDRELQLDCPEHKLMYQYDAYKVILSADPSLCPDNYVVVAIFAFRASLTYFKSGYTSWKHVDWNDLPLSDVVFYKGMLYGATGGWCRLVSIDIINDSSASSSSSSNPQLKMVARSSDLPARTYVVESLRGELLFVKKFHDEEKDIDIQPVTKCFEVYKVEDGRRLLQEYSVLEMVKMESIGQDVIFLGDNYSMSVSTLDFPELQPNSIYYTEDWIQYGNPYQPFGPRDMGIFNLENGRITQHYVPNIANKDMPPPIWIVPIMQSN